MANSGKDDNGFQFFFTLRSTPDVQNKHTIFGKFTGETICNMLKLEEALVDENDRLLYLPRLIKTIILNNPFSDIIPRIIVQESEEVKDSSKTKAAAVRDFNLLSFGEEAEEDEEEPMILNKSLANYGVNVDKEKRVVGKKAVRIIEEIENGHLVIVIKVQDKLNRECNCCIKAQMCRYIYRNLGTISGIMRLRHIEFIGPITSTLKEGRRRNFIRDYVSCRRDLIAMANAGKDDNSSQFFLTLSSTPDLQNKHTIFGKFTGETICNLLKLEEAIVDEESEEVKDSSKTKGAAVRHYNLLSFGEEAEDDEEESVILNKKFRDKDKLLAHDHLTDPKLSSQPAVETPGLVNKKRRKTVVAIEKVTMK
ncbi:Peptidyl-prolyl cis-trans isomerase CWC27 like protein [Eufriesea mexicana]|nr:Peptidyl-prolyl cis-trans isomerase CWC27 like protein [Eufriesea mexicana]